MYPCLLSNLFIYIFIIASIDRIMSLFRNRDINFTVCGFVNYFTRK